MASEFLISALRARLLNDTDVTDITNTRVYYLESPEKPTYPYLLIHEIDDSDENSIIGKDGSSPRIQIDSVDKNESVATVKTLDLAVRSSLNDFSGDMDGIQVNWTVRGGSKVFREPENILRITRDFICFYNRP